MPKYIVTENILITLPGIEETILKKGDEIEINDTFYNVDTPFGNLGLSYDSIKNNLKLKEDINIQVTALDDEDLIKDYRIQLDIKVSRKKAREIENYLRETLERMI